MQETRHRPFVRHINLRSEDTRMHTRSNMVTAPSPSRSSPGVLEYPDTPSPSRCPAGIMDDLRQNFLHTYRYPSPSSSITHSTDGIAPLTASTALKAKPPRKSTTTKAGRRSRSSPHIPRPRNPFMIYRSEFYAAEKITLALEHDHRHISRIISICWNKLTEEEKKPWKDKAAIEKAEHQKKYPDYQYTPVRRLEPPKRRKVRRNSTKDLQRCETVAHLIRQGKEGKELESAVHALDLSVRPELNEPHGGFINVFDSQTPAETTQSPSPYSSFSCAEVPIFRSPLIAPPSELAPADKTSYLDEVSCGSLCHTFRSSLPPLTLPLELSQVPAGSASSHASTPAHMFASLDFSMVNWDGLFSAPMPQLPIGPCDIAIQPQDLLPTVPILTLPNISMHPYLLQSEHNSAYAQTYQQILPSAPLRFDQTCVYPATGSFFSAMDFPISLAERPYAETPHFIDTRGTLLSHPSGVNAQALVSSAAAVSEPGPYTFTHLDIFSASARM